VEEVVRLHREGSHRCKERPDLWLCRFFRHCICFLSHKSNICSRIPRYTIRRAGSLYWSGNFEYRCLLSSLGARVNNSVLSGRCR
jgi:hypothetical protein